MLSRRRNPDLDKSWEIARNLICDENDLINQRMTWLISSNLFLFSAFFLIFNRPKEVELQNPQLTLTFSFFIPIIGITICGIGWVLVRSAASQIDQVADWWRKRLKSHPEHQFDYPSIVRGHLFGLEGWLSPFSILPLVLMIAWVLLLCATQGLIAGTPRELFFSGLFLFVETLLAIYIVKMGKKLVTSQSLRTVRIHLIQGLKQPFVRFAPRAWFRGRVK
jgi:hypothetical protein